VYALGTILYEMLAGKTPFTGDSNMAIMAQHLHGTAQRLDRINPLVSAPLAAVVATCLARNPEDRYGDMDGLIDALDHPENVDVTILDKLNASPAPPTSLTQRQVLQGILIAAGIMGVLIILALALQYLHR
jgi:serine/threonine protein kinase